MSGYGEATLEQWKIARFIGWSAWVAQRGNQDVKEPKDWLKLPGDIQKIIRSEFDEIFKEVQKKWMQP